MAFKVIAATGDYRKYTPAICEIWNAAFGPEFPLTERLWEQNTSGDPSFRPADLALAFDAAGTLAGIALIKLYRPGPDEPAGPGMQSYLTRGYLAALAVRPDQQRQGLGLALLAEAEARLWSEQVEKISLGGALRHFLPGVPSTCRPALEFFRRAGYNFEDEPDSFDLEGELKPELFQPALARDRNVEYRPGRSDQAAGLLEFLAEVFPGRWHYDAELYLRQGGLMQDIILMLDPAGRAQGFLMTYWSGSRVLGPGVYWHVEDPAWGGIGPLGISPAARGQGVGLGLVAAGMRELHRRGAWRARIDWTGLTGFYGRLGFEVATTYRHASKQR